MAKQAAAETDHVTLATDTLVGDLRDFILDRLKHEHQPLPWNMRSERDQHDMIERTESAVRTWVHRAVTIIASGGQKAARGSLVKFQAKDGIQLQVNLAASDELRHAIMDNVGGPVLLILADTERFVGERSPVPIRKDQGDVFDEAAE